MPKKYTSYQMRVASKACEELGLIAVTSMLLQAADDMEREKRWEYAVMYTALNGCRCISPGRADCIAATKNILSLYNKECEDANIVRREVGKWEEVTNDNN